MWRLNEEQQMLRDTVQQLAREELAPRAAELDAQQAFPDAWFTGLGELGLFGMTLPEELGGAGLGELAAAIAIEELARGCAATASVLATHLFQVVPAVAGFGGDELQGEVLEELATGAAIGAVAISEVQAGCDLAALQAKASAGESGFEITGTKTQVAGVSVARQLLVAAHGEGDPSLETLSLFLIDREVEGIDVNDSPGSLGLCAAGAATVRLDAVRVGLDRRLGGAGEGHRQLEQLRTGANVGAAAVAVGIAQAALDQAVEYAKTRKTFDIPIAQHQAIAFKIADMTTDVQAARALLYEAASSREAGQPHQQAAAVAKLFATEAAQRCTFEAVQIFGGYGYSKEYPVERLYRDARMGTLNDGTSEMQRTAIAASALD